MRYRNSTGQSKSAVPLFVEESYSCLGIDHHCLFLHGTIEDIARIRKNGLEYDDVFIISVHRKNKVAV